MLYRLFNKVIYIGIFFLLTFSQVNSYSGEINTQNSYLISNKIEVIEKVDLVITGYYSPLPNQKKYITGSYEKEIALNGDGIGMASGKKVFTGALATPKKYEFGTKIYIEGYGVGSVEDRGGKLIDDTHTRIDIWMGYGDEGLERAIKLGSRKTTGYIVKNDTEINFNFGDPLGESYKINNKYDYLKLTPESSEEIVKKVQQFFKDYLLYFGEIDGKYDNIKPIILKYQLQKGIIKSSDEEVAGYIGPKTISTIYIDFDENNILKKEDKEKLYNQVSKIKKKLGNKYKLNAKKILDKIKVLKNKDILDRKIKIQLEYLEMIL